MREIKFKAKRKDNNEWVYGYYHKEVSTSIALQEYGINEIEEHYIHTVIDHLPFKIEVLPETICEYTGIKDKNGVEIYENDKVKYDYEFSTEIGVITYNQNNASYQIKGISSSSMKHHKQLIVIGNIFDNSELLEKSDKQWIG